MPKKILSVLSHIEDGNLEDSDISLFTSVFASVAGRGMTLLLREDAVNYAVRGQDGTRIKIAGILIQPGVLIETDLQSLRQSNIPIYAIQEDAEKRGIKKADLVQGVELLSRTRLGRFVDQFDTVWNW